MLDRFRLLADAGPLPRCFAALAIVCFATVVVSADDPSFDDEIAPLLARRCLSCHDGSAKEGGLDLSSVESAFAGGESGKVLSGDDGESSLLWQRVRDDEMPPEDPLDEHEKQLLHAWIAAGVKWGAETRIDPFKYSSDLRGGYDWWALQPLAKHDPPPFNNTTWLRNPIDQFVLAELEHVDLQPAGRAPSVVLLRRLYLDLIGLPPLIHQHTGVVHERLLEFDIDLEKFATDDEEYLRVVDHLLASPHFGERWARHWLDVIRFGESQGFERNRIRENAWRYRDWVVRAFNDDMPYDRFVQAQIAGDILWPEDLDSLLATGFLVCGTWDQVGHNEGSPEMRKSVRQDELEDLVGTFGQAFLGLTTNCARCHDHKFDPLSQRDYYQLAAALGGVTQKEKEREGITLRRSDDHYARWEAKLALHRQQLAEFQSYLEKKYGEEVPTKPIAGLVAYYSDTASDARRSVNHVRPGTLDLQANEKAPWSTVVGADQLVRVLQSSHEFTIDVWLTPQESNQAGPARIVTLSRDSGSRNFTLGHDGDRLDFRLRTSQTDSNGLPSTTTSSVIKAGQRMHVVVTYGRQGEVTIYVDGKESIRRSVGGDLSNWDGSFVLAIGDELSGQRRWQGSVHSLAIFSRALSSEEVLRQYDTQSKLIQDGAISDELLQRASDEERLKLIELRSALSLWEQQEPAQSFGGTAHVVIPEQPPTFHVLARGNYRQPLDVVTPGGIRALSLGGLSEDFGLAPDASDAERRRQLALWATSTNNPLTARVIVNRLWHYHFGQGIVDTPSDFGFAGGKPTHPELLDWLALRLRDGGWKLKDMHRLIVMSATYRQASNVDNPLARERDSDNRLLWHFNRRRLEGEVVRDSMLCVAGSLNRRLGGPSFRDVAVKLQTNHEFTDPTGEFNDSMNRRTLYRLWARAGNNPFLESLDCPDPSVMLPRRPRTITPVQSLALINNRFTENCAEQLASRAIETWPQQQTQQIAWLYQRVLLRSPSVHELAATSEFARQYGLQQLAIVLLNTNEFLFCE